MQRVTSLLSGDDGIDVDDGSGRRPALVADTMPLSFLFLRFFRHPEAEEEYDNLRRDQLLEMMPSSLRTMIFMCFLFTFLTSMDFYLFSFTRPEASSMGAWSVTRPIAQQPTVRRSTGCLQSVILTPPPFPVLRWQGVRNRRTGRSSRRRGVHLPALFQAQPVHADLHHHVRLYDLLPARHLQVQVQYAGYQLRPEVSIGLEPHRVLPINFNRERVPAR
jgi:hypothetical protein